MKKGLLLGAIALGFAVAGCGGSTSATSLVPNQYRGSWTGNWSSTTLNDGGVATWTVYSDGSITGTLTLTSTNATANCVGTVNGLGNFQIQAGFGALGNYDLQGTMTKNAAKVDCVYTTYWNGTGYNSNVSLAAATSSGG